LPPPSPGLPSAALRYLLVPYELAGPEHTDALLRVAADGFALTVFRAETLSFYDALDRVLGSLKDPKRVAKQRTVILDAVANSVSTAPVLHQVSLAPCALFASCVL